MYPSPYYPTMKPKKEMFRGRNPQLTSGDTYQKWKLILEGPNANKWDKLTSRFAEDFQFAILRAMTITGVSCANWDYVFQIIGEAQSPFQDINTLALHGQLPADWRFFAHKLALETYINIFYPCLCPEWLFSYGYSQKQYLSDLAVYWENIADGYYRPWETTRFGEDSPELVRLKKLGQQARSEIDQVARHSEKYIKR